MNDGGAAEVEEVLAAAAVAGAGVLPAPEVSQAVLDGDALTELGAAGWAPLTLAQLGQEALVGVNRDGAAVGAGGAAGAEGHGHVIGAAQPISQSRAKAVLGKRSPLQTGQALQKMVRSGGRSRTQPLLR